MVKAFISFEKLHVASHSYSNLFVGHYVKDLSLFTNRDISQTIIIDNSPMSYMFQPENAIDCTSFYDSPSDTEMWQVKSYSLDTHTLWIKPKETTLDRRFSHRY